MHILACAYYLFRYFKSASKAYTLRFFINPCGSYSQEILWNIFFKRLVFFILGCRLIGFVVLLQVFVQLKNGSNIIEPVAVIWCRPDCDQLVVKHRPVAIHYQLVRSEYDVYVIFVVEFFHHISAKKIACASWGQVESFHVLFWIRPHHIRHGSIMWNLDLAINLHYIVEGFYIWRKTSVNAEQLPLN